LVDLATCSDDAEESKPAPDIFEVVLKKLKIEGADAVAIGDTPYDAAAAGKAKIATIGVLCGGFTEGSLRQAGCVEIYPGPATLFARFFALAAMCILPCHVMPQGGIIRETKTVSAGHAGKRSIII